MKVSKALTIEYTLHENLESLHEAEQNLAQKARSACKLAHAPYSKFNVGAVVWLDDGTFLQGANQENASYPLCNCAEQVVLNYSAMFAPDKKVQAIGVAVDAVADEVLGPVSPCGACRQIILEQEIKQGSNIKLYLFGKNEQTLVFESIKDLIPFHFSF